MVTISGRPPCMDDEVVKDFVCSLYPTSNAQLKNLSLVSKLYLANPMTNITVVSGQPYD